MNDALVRAWWVAKAAVRERVTAAAVGTALALLLGIGGCSLSHGTSGTDADRDGFESDVDCNDGDADIHPGAPEPPPDFDCCVDAAGDFDCDGVPFACSCNPFPDFDGDGYPAWEDCNDADATIYPGAPEPSDYPACCGGASVDRDCDGVPPICVCNPLPDLDGDGFGSDVDCDDSDASVNPGVLEEPCPDGVDQDCSGVDGDPDLLGTCEDPDEDGDGYPRSSDCNDSDPGTNPGVSEWECPDGVDQDCDGVDGDPDLICNGMADAPEDDAEAA